MALSNYFENQLIDFLFRGGSFTPPATLYVALCTTTPTAADTGTTIVEVSSGNYSRVAVGTGHTLWYSTQGNTDFISTGTTGITANVSPIIWNSVRWAATLTAIAICDAATDGNLIYFSQFNTTKNIVYGSNINFDSNSLQLNFS